MFGSNPYFNKKDPLIEAVKVARQEGDLRRAAEAIVNEEFGVYSRKAVIREELAAYDAALEQTYTDLKEGKKLADKDYDGDGERETPKDEVWGSRFRAAKKAGKMEEGLDVVKRDPSVQGSGDVTKSAPKEDPSTPKSYPGAASSLTPGNPTSQRMSNAVKPKLQEAVSRKHFQQVADLIKGHESQEKRNELATHHAGIFAKQNPRFNHEKFHAAAGSTAHQSPKKMEEAAYSAKAARAGKDIGKPGKNFEKIADKASKRYGSKKRGEAVAGAILNKIRAKRMEEDSSF